MLKLAIKILVNSKEVMETAINSITAPLVAQFVESINSENKDLLSRYVKELGQIKEESVKKDFAFNDNVTLTEKIYGDIEIEKDLLMVIPFCAQSSVIRYTSNIKNSKNLLTIIDDLARWNEEASNSFLYMTNIFSSDSKPVLYELTNSFKKQKTKLAEAGNLLKDALKHV
ncbi:MAG: hypothetical protein JXA66_05025 [Oligoflexia bacterium]|nr:hypothetical protein [Oligoflexia bacterium]